VGIGVTPTVAVFPAGEGSRADQKCLPGDFRAGRLTPNRKEVKLVQNDRPANQSNTRLGVRPLRRTDRSSVQTGPSWIFICPAIQRAFLLVVLLTTGSASLAQISSQSLQQDDQQSIIKGTVVNAVTHAPIARALVQTPGNSYAMLTDGEGHFEFALPKVDSNNTLAESRYAFGPSVLIARKPGFLDDPNVRLIEATPGSEITIPLLPEALIKGRVILSEADPALGITVQIFSRQVQEGKPKWVPAGSARANSNGEFRFAELLPGTYKLVTNELMDNDPAATVPGGQQYGFPPVYYPGGSDFAAAGTIQLAAGQILQADIPLTRQPYYPVRIPVANADLNAGMNITVSVQGHRGPGYSLGYNAEKQRVEGLLPHGNYLVEASTFGQNSAFGAVHLSVAGAPAEGPSLTLTPNSSISVHVVEEFTSTDGHGSGTWNVGGRSVTVHGPRLYLQINAETADDFGQPGHASLRPPSGANDDPLVLENLAPGRYWLRLHSSRGYVAAATMGGVDVLHELLIVAPGSSTPIEVTMRDDSAELDGTVAGLAAPPAMTDSAVSSRFSPPQAWVYCIPLPDSPGQFEQLGLSPDGKFNSQAMAPGTYRVLASKNQQTNFPYRDAEAMKAFDAKGQVVHLSAGQKTSVQLQIIPSIE
jgi:hypothetical protein